MERDAARKKKDSPFLPEQAAQAVTEIMEWLVASVPDEEPLAVLARFLTLRFANLPVAHTVFEAGGDGDWQDSTWGYWQGSGDVYVPYLEQELLSPDERLAHHVRMPVVTPADAERFIGLAISREAPRNPHAGRTAVPRHRSLAGW